MAAEQSLTDLEERDRFVGRHVGPDADEQSRMLATLGISSLDELIDRAVPESIRTREPLRVPAARSEADVVARLRDLAQRNEVFTSLMGMGYSDTITPPVIQRNVLEDPAWYTAYTPYQPEISQGRLEALLNFQTMVSDLTAMDIANASLLDEATAAAEAMAMFHRLNPKAGATFVVDADCHPQTVDVLRTRAEPIGVAVVVADAFTGDGSADGGDVFGALLQYPASGGAVRDLRPVIERFHDQDALVAVAADLLALVLLRAPGEMGADAVVGSSQRFGVPLGFGGPHAAYFATRDAHKRSMPGRLVGVSVDAAGRPALRLALQTREQHIRREKATSNICTAQVLNALAGVIYLSWLGRRGVVELAELMLQRTDYARRTLTALPGVRALHAQPVVREFAVALDAPVERVIARCQEEGVNPGYALGRDYPEHEDGLLVAITERRSRADIDRLADVLGRAVAAESRELAEARA